MSALDLYHGGERPVPAPQVVSPRRVRPLDFGTGFYTTTCLEQARKWVGVRIRQGAYAAGAVSHYTMDGAVLRDAALKVRVFHGPEEDWFDFVMANRHEPGFAHDYDLVVGPVANDNVYETLTLFEDGILTKAEAVVRLKTYVLVDQVLFHSAAALSKLAFIGSEDFHG